MKTLKVFAVIGLVLWAVQSPTMHSVVNSGLHKVTGQQVTVSANDQATFDRLCPLMDAYFKVDGAGQGVTRKAITTLAKTAAKTTTDPAVTAFLNTVPAAVADGKSAQSRAAKALVTRECSAHGTGLTDH